MILRDVGDVGRCWAMLGDVRRCWAMLGDVGRCWAMLGDVGVSRCWPLLGVIFLQITSRDIDEYRLLTQTPSYLYAPPFFVTIDYNTSLWWTRL